MISCHCNQIMWLYLMKRLFNCPHTHSLLSYQWATWSLLLKNGPFDWNITLLGCDASMGKQYFAVAAAGDGTSLNNFIYSLVQHKFILFFHFWTWTESFSWYIGSFDLFGSWTVIQMKPSEKFVIWENVYLVKLLATYRHLKCDKGPQPVFFRGHKPKTC